MVTGTILVFMFDPLSKSGCETPFVESITPQARHSRRPLHNVRRCVQKLRSLRSRKAARGVVSGATGMSSFRVGQHNAPLAA